MRVLGKITFWQILALAALLVASGSWSAVAGDSALDWENPIVQQRADPHVRLHSDGYYYLIATVPEYDRLELRRARSLGGLSTAAARTIWSRPTEGPMSGVVWAPELHFLDGSWFIYFSGGVAGGPWDSVRVHVLENKSANPLEGEWTHRGQIETEWDTFSLDPTVFENAGERYLLWTQIDPSAQGTNIYMSKLDTPTTIVGKIALLTRPELAWEKQVYWVNEAPAVLQRNGKVFVTFSASATDHNYCVGLLTASADTDLLDEKSWSKSPLPVLKSSEATSQYGPGHNSFTTTPDGKTDIIVYHSRQYKAISGDSLANPDRSTRAQALRWSEEGLPLFGEPVADGPYSVAPFEQSL